MSDALKRVRVITNFAALRHGCLEIVDAKFRNDCLKGHRKKDPNRAWENSPVGM